MSGCLPGSIEDVVFQASFEVQGGPVRPGCPGVEVL
jgi:hypothetical protein